MALYRQGEQSFANQVIAGTTGYLAYSQLTDMAYCPHPTRAKFIQSVLYQHDSSTRALRRFENLVDTTRLRVAQSVGGEATVTSTNCKISSVALLCLSESSSESPVIQTALQMRYEKEMKALRGFLHEMQQSIARNDRAEIIKQSKVLEDAINEVQRRLGLRQLEAKDGPQEITVFSLPVRVPAFLNRPLRTPRHTSAIFRLAQTGAHDLRTVLKRSLGIADPRIIEDLRLI